MKTIYKITFFAGILLICSNNLFAQIIVTDTIYPNKDATVSSRYPDTNFGNSSTFCSYLYNAKEPEIKRSFIEFDLSDVPVDAHVISADFYLFGISHIGQNKSLLNPIVQSWEESIVTYNRQPKLSDENIVLSQSSSLNQNYVVNLQLFTQEWISNPSTNFGLALRIADVNLEKENGLFFGSSDNFDNHLIPYLIISYQITPDLSTKLIATDCNITNMPLDHVLTAEIVPTAIKYEFKVTEVSTGNSVIINKPVNYFSLYDTGLPVNYNSQYEVWVRTFDGVNLGEFGEMCSIKTALNVNYQPGKLFAKVYPFEPTALGIYERYSGEAISSSIENMDQMAIFCGISKIENTFKLSRNLCSNLNGIFTISFDNYESVDSLMAFLVESNKFEYVEKVPEVKFETDPVDELYSSQEYLPLINAPGAWNYSTSGELPIIAVLDNAFYLNHIDLDGNLWINTAEASGILSEDEDGNGLYNDIHGWDFGNNDDILTPPDLSEGWSHGTHVAGIAGAETIFSATDPLSGVASISANNCQLMLLKCWNNNGFGYMTYCVAAIDYAISKNADIINMSWGIEENNLTLRNAVLAANAQDILMVAAAGNYHSEIVPGPEYNYYPAQYEEVMCIGASCVNDPTYEDDAKADFSNYGYCVDVVAPGTHILSTGSNGGYLEMSGTSMSTPLVSGLAALMMAVNPAITPEIIRNCIRNTATDVSGISGNAGMPWEDGMGTGRIDAEKAVQCVFDLASQPPIASFSSNYQTTCTSNMVWFNFEPEPGLTMPTNYIWDFGDGTIIEGLFPNISHVFTVEGSYAISLTVENGSESDNLTIENYILVDNSTFYIDGKMDNIWSVSNSNGINFNDGYTLPYEIVNQTQEGSASISNHNGNLLFYTSHESLTGDLPVIYNRNLIPMECDLWDENFESNSSTQGAVIVPFPTSDCFINKYYVFFTPSVTSLSDYLYCAIVNMDLNFGYGGIESVFQVSDFTSVVKKYTEGITAVVGCNPEEIFVVCHEESINNFLIHKVDESGITPVEPSSIGSISSNSCQSVIKISPDGKMLAIKNMTSVGSNIEVFSFNNEIGVVESPIIENYQYDGIFGTSELYFIEFSPNGENLFSTKDNYLMCHKLSNFNDLNPIYNEFFHLRGMQLNPNDQISILSFSNKLVTLNSPNDYVDPGIQEINSFFPNLIQSGLSNTYISRWTRHNSNILGIQDNYIMCHGENISIEATSGFSEYIWTGPDGNVLSETSNSIEISIPGEYSVEVVDANGCHLIAETNVHEESPGVTIGAIVDCSNISSSITLNAGMGYASYIWSNGSTSPSIDVSTPGTYSITVTTESGCTASDEIVLNLPYQPMSVDLLIDNAICIDIANGSITANPIGGNPSYSYYWSNGCNIQVNEGLVSGNYTVTVYDVFGCSASASGTIDPDYPFTLPVVNIVEPTGCLVLGNVISFNGETTFADSWLWDFGDGITAITEDATHPYNFSTTGYGYGYYCVSLTAENVCGQTSQNISIFINPSDCSCAPAVVYNFPNGLIVPVGPLFNYNADLKINGDLIIPPGATLQIDNNHVFEFGPEGRIIIMRGDADHIGGRLIIRGAVLTTLNSCNDYMWKGIEVWGYPDLSSTDTKQGNYWVLQHYSTISNAHIGVLLGARNDEVICSTNEMKFDQSMAGGVARISGTSTLIGNFIGNGIDVKFLEKNPPYDASNNVFVYCNFDWGNNNPRIDMFYNSAFANSYPNDQNPWAGYANEHQRSDVGMFINSQRDIVIKNCKFNNKHCCIKSFNTEYNVELCRFENSRDGIKIQNYLSTIHNHDIIKCTFDMIPGEINKSGKAISLIGTRHDYICNNDFGLLATPQEFNDVGIYTSGSSSFRISENEFNSMKTGIIIKDSKEYGGYIGAYLSLDIEAPNWQGNYFYECKKGIVAHMDNSNLKLKCNQYNHADASLYDVNIENFNQLADMGSPLPWWVQTASVYAYRLPVGDLFYPTDENEFWTVKTMTSSVDFYRHNLPDYTEPIDVSPSSPEFNPQLATDGSIYSGFELSLAEPDGVLKPRNLYCPPPRIILPVELPVPIQRDMQLVLDSMQNEIELIEAEIQSIELTLDNGRTDELLENIYSNMSTGKLKNKLIANSPLSDVVLIALHEENKLSPGNYMQLMEKNLPVTKDVEPYFYDRLSITPPGIANYLKKLQASNPGVATIGSYESQIAHVELEKQIFFNDLIIALTDSVNNREEDALSLIEEQSKICFKQEIAATYLDKKQIPVVNSIISEIVTEDEEIIDWIAITDILVNLFNQGREIYELNEMEMAQIREIAYKCPAGLGSDNAKAILSLLFNEEVPECPVEITTRSMSFSNTEKIDVRNVIDTEWWLGENYPEPCIDLTKISCFFDEGLQGTIVIRDIYGRTIDQFLLINNEAVEIETIKFSEGVYFYSLYVDGEYVDTKKMTVIK